MFAMALRVYNAYDCMINGAKHLQVTDLKTSERKKRTRQINDLARPDAVEPVVGVEPTTCCLRNSCSATELHRRIAYAPKL